MNIYILDADPAKIPELLADDDLSGMIEEIAYLLATAYESCVGDMMASMHNDFLNIYTTIIKYPVSSRGLWERWICECIANYRYLVGLGLACCNEFNFRFNSEHKERADIYTVTTHPSQPAIEWCRDNEPELSTETECASFPLVMPDDFKEVCDDEECAAIDTIFSYCIYYAHTLEGKDFCYTRREKPEFLK